MLFGERIYGSILGFESPETKNYQRKLLKNYNEVKVLY
jgi:hypothetical protein